MAAWLEEMSAIQRKYDRKRDRVWLWAERRGSREEVGARAQGWRHRRWGLEPKHSPGNGPSLKVRRVV